jgi:hypothetical protein
MTFNVSFSIRKFAHVTQIKKTYGTHVGSMSQKLSHLSIIKSQETLQPTFLPEEAEPPVKELCKASVCCSDDFTADYYN